jgi:copper chaperone CopZ
MRTNFRIVALTALTLLVAGAIVYAERSRPRQIIVPVEGMVCEGCEEHLREKLLSASGVESVAPSHKEAQVTVVVAGWLHADDTELREIIKRAGYKPIETE